MRKRRGMSGTERERVGTGRDERACRNETGADCPLSSVPCFLSTAFCQLLNFFLGGGVDFADGVVGDFLDFVFGAAAFVLAEFLVFDLFFHGGDDVAADVARGDPGGFGFPPDDFGEVAPSLFGELRNGHADLRPLRGGVEPEVGLPHGFFNGGGVVGIPGRNQQRPAVGDRHGRGLRQGDLGAVDGDGDGVEHSGVRPSGANFGEVGAQGVDRFLHATTRVVGGVHGCGGMWRGDVAGEMWGRKKLARSARFELATFRFVA